MVKVVALAGPFTDAREHRIARVHLGDVVDQFHDQNRLAHAGAAEQADLAALGIGSQQVDDLDAGDQDLGRGRLGGEIRGLLVDGTGLGRFDGAAFVDGLADDVQDAAQRRVADRNHDRAAGILDRQATDQTFGRVHGDGADGVLAQVLGHFQHQALAVVLGFQSVQNRRKLTVELHVDDGADHLRDFSIGLCHVSTSTCQSASAPEMISISSLVIAA